MVMNTDTMINIALGVLVFASLGGVIAGAVSDASGNFSGASLVLWVLVPLFVVIIFIRGIAKSK